MLGGGRHAPSVSRREPQQTNWKASGRKEMPKMICRICRSSTCSAAGVSEKWPPAKPAPGEWCEPVRKVALLAVRVAEAPTARPADTR